MSSQLRAVLFDFDDTLIDWSGVQLGWREIESARLTRVQAYISQIYPDCYIEARRLIDVYWDRSRSAWSEARVSLRAPNMPGILLSTLAELGVPRETLVSEDILRAYDWNVVPGTVVFADVPPLLKLLQSNGINAGIVTNASQPMWMRDAELRAHGLIEYFSDCRLSAADTGYLKPHLRMFRTALETMGTLAVETVFVGDNPVADVAGAQAAGMRAVRRLNPGARESGHLAKPHATLRTFKELPALLDSWYPDWRQGGQ